MAVVNLKGALAQRNAGSFRGDKNGGLCFANPPYAPFNSGYHQYGHRHPS